jgi:hypothetical protein
MVQSSAMDPVSIVISRQADGPDATDRGECGLAPNALVTRRGRGSRADGCAAVV